MTKTVKRQLVVLSAIMLAATGMSAQAGEEEPGDDPRIGEEVDRICFSRNINSWRTIDGDRKAVILRRSVRKEFRVTYSGACTQSDFRFALKIGIVNRPAGGCVTRGDYLLVEGPGRMVNRCYIDQINKWHKDAKEDQEDEVSIADD